MFVRQQATDGNNFRKANCRIFGLALIIVALSLTISSVRAQIPDRRYPSLSYFAAFTDFYAGDYKTALNRFQAEARGAMKTPQARWIDSICYETMVGECYYQMGMLERALEHYHAALEIYIVYYDWMIRVQFQPIRLAGARKVVPWGASTRQSQLGSYPSSMLITEGRLLTGDVVKQGGVIQGAVSFSIQPQEIVRCTTLALRRRSEVLGPLCKYDPLSDRLLAALSRPVAPPNQWPEAWGDLERGLVFIAAGKESQGLNYLQRSVLAMGQFDHPLTSVALLELGRIKLLHGEYQEAAKFFEEAAYAAVDYPDPGVLEESFRHWALTYLVANNKGFFTPLVAAWQWTKTKDLLQFRVSLALSAAENYAVLDQTRDALAMLDDARTVIGRKKMLAADLAARLHYLSALVSFQQQKIKEAQTDFATAIGILQQSSRRLFQIALLDKYYAGGNLTPRSAVELYREALRDPLPSDWTLDPLESYAVLVTPHFSSYDNWFEVAMQRREHEVACEIADRARRHRFFCSLPMGGRLESLRWILEGPAEALDQQSQLLRKDLLTRRPQYAELAEQAGSVRAKIASLPLVPEDQESWREQSKAMAELAALSVKQEMILREIALRREPAGMIFPPLRTTAEAKKSLPDGHAILIFYSTGRRLYGFLMNNANYSYWELDLPQNVSRQITTLLHEMGQRQQNYELSLKDLNDAKWNNTAAKVLDSLLRSSRADFSKPFEELVIVPDGALWYLPFEALTVNVNGQLQPLISRFRIRYAPTMSLATATYPRALKPGANTAVVLGKLFPHDDEAVSKEAFQRLAASLPGAKALQSPWPGLGRIYKVFFDRLIVFDDLEISEQEPYGWTPMPGDRAKNDATLADWLALPWGAPTEIILPGYHTAAEDALKRAPQVMPGNEVFLSLCGLMSSGTRTVLLSRWRSGGKSSFNLIREFAQELPHTSPAEAWQRAVLLQIISPLDLDAEPRVKSAPTEETLKANHPFFWAGYMLVDSGEGPQKTVKTEEKEAKPENPKAPAEKADEVPKSQVKPQEKPPEPPQSDQKPQEK